MATFEELFEEAVEHEHLPARIDELIVDNLLVRARVDGPIEEERVRADFAELHDGILEVHIVHARDCDQI